MRNNEHGIGKAKARANMAWLALPDEVRAILTRVDRREWAREECFPDSLDDLKQEKEDYDRLLEMLK